MTTWEVAILGNAVSISIEKDGKIVTKKLKNQSLYTFKLPKKYLYKWTYSPPEFSNNPKFDVFITLKNNKIMRLVPKRRLG